METCNFCPTLHRSVGQSGGPASGAGAFFKSRRPCGGGPAFPPAGPPCKLIRNEECFLNQTANYQLCQWDPTDRILMEDFNKDNEKIDAALKANADAIAAEVTARAAGDVYVKLLDMTTEAAAQTITVDLSQLDLSPYQYLDVVADIPGNFNEVWMRVNNIQSYTLPGSASTVGYFAVSQYDDQVKNQIRARIIGRGGARLFCSFYDLSYQDDIIRATYCGGTIEGIQSLQFFQYVFNSPSPVTPAGARITMYGMKR